MTMDLMFFLTASDRDVREAINDSDYEAPYTFEEVTTALYALAQAAGIRLTE